MIKKLIIIFVLNFACLNQSMAENGVRSFELSLMSAWPRWQYMITLCDRAIKEYPDYPFFYYEKANALTQLGKYQEAIEVFDMTIKHINEAEKGISKEYLYYRKALCLQKVDRLGEALEYYKLAANNGCSASSMGFDIDGARKKARGVGEE